MSRIIDFERYRNSKEIAVINDNTDDHRDASDYPLDGIFYADDDYDTPADNDFMWDLEP
jgi:hypothetical protein